jgi:hypothetical protein
MSNPNNQFAPFFMRYVPKTADCGVDLGSFSLTVFIEPYPATFEQKQKRENFQAEFKHLNSYQTFTFFADKSMENWEKLDYQNENSTFPPKSTRAQIPPPLSNLPAEVAVFIDNFVRGLVEKHGIGYAVCYPKDENEANNFQNEAEKQADNFARISTEKRTHARKLSNAAQDVLNKDVLYIS